MLAYLNYDHFI